MLTELQIKNVAIIDNITINFGAGFNVLTGETGAGKSILIDSINMALGGRTAKDLVRNGTEYAFSQAVFELNETVGNKLTEYDIELEDNTLILSRKITADGKSSCRINGRTAPLSIVREIGNMLLNIHGQLDNQALLVSSKHREFVDNFAGNKDILAEYSNKYLEYSKVLKKFEELQQSEIDKEHRIELLKFQVNEIKSASLRPGEEEELIKRREFLMNVENIMSNAIEAHNALYGDEMTKSAYDMLYDANQSLEKAAEYDEKLSNYYDTISSVLADIDDVTRELKSYIDGIDYEPEEIDIVQNRLALIADLKRKYNCLDIDSVLEYCNRCEEEIAEIENLENTIEAIKDDVKKSKNALTATAKKLTETRIKAGEFLAESIMRELAELDMNKVVFKVRITESDFTISGCDDIEFLISTNPGENLKPLSKIASGGEMSRIMLAIKSILSKGDIVDTLIFDEIDTGVSGRAAQKISEKICKISRTKQVLCITHLAQIASMGDFHYLIHKDSDETKTRTFVNLLSTEERKDELSRIIGGVSVTDTTLKAAEEMLQQAENLKDSFI